jgi:hypothetical protein
MQVDDAFYVSSEDHSTEAVRMAASRASHDPTAVRKKLRYAVRRDNKGCWVYCERRTHSRKRNNRDTTVDPTTLIRPNR